MLAATVGWPKTEAGRATLRHEVHRRRHAERWAAVRPRAGQQQVSASVPPPQPPPLSTNKSPSPWALGAGVVAVAAAAIRVAWANRGKPLTSLNDPAAAAAAAATASPLPGADAASASATVGAADFPAVQAARDAAQAAEQLLESGGLEADAAAGLVGPLLLAAETGGAVDEALTAALSLEELQSLATELYLLIQQMEVQLQEAVAELAELLPEASQAQLDELAEQMEAVEERLAALKGREDAEGRVMAAERAYSDLQWRLFDLVTAGAADRQRRSLRSLLFNLTSQRQLLRQVEGQEALRLRMRGVEQRISTLLDEGQPGAAAEAVSVPGRAQGAAHPPPPSLQAVEPPDGEEAEAAAGQLRLLSAGASMPHAAKAATGGEDAFFLSSLGLGAVGVADGVGGWAAQGVDPSLYPRALVAACQEVLQEARQGRRAAGGGLGEPPGAPALLQAAYERARAPGSSTALLASLLPGGRLSVAHLGDCELRVLRGGQVVFTTQVLEHQWNMPLQLSWPEFYDCGSRPADADVHEVAVAPGDVLVAGSDGLWDNLWEEQLEAAVARVQEQATAAPLQVAQQLAAQLAGMAYRQSVDPAFRSPFAVERAQRAAAEEGGLQLPDTGGKQDDVTVVVAVVAAPL